MVDLSDLGPQQSQSIDLSDLGPQASQQAPQSTGIGSSLLQTFRAPLDLASGVAKGVGGILDTPHALYPSIPNAVDPNHNYFSMFGINDPTMKDQVMQGVGQFAPFLAGGELGLLGKVPSLLGRQALESGAYGLTQDQNHPYMAAGVDAATGLGGAILGKGAGNTVGGIANYVENNKLVNQAPDYLNSLASGVPDRTNIPMALSDHLSQLYKDNKTTVASDPFYGGLNKLDMQFGANNMASFPNYASSAQNLIDAKDHLTDLFGNASDMPAALRSEIGKAENFMTNPDDTTPVNFQDIWGRMKQLGKLGEQLSTKDNYAASLVGDLRSNLGQDLATNLNQQGYQDVAQQLTRSNNFFKNNIVPFWENPTIAKTVQNPRYIPQGSSVSQALFNPSVNSQLVFDQMSPEMKNAAIYQRVTDEKGTSSGQSNLIADQIGTKYAALPDYEKARIASHNPQADQMFQSLSDMFAPKTKFGWNGVGNDVMRRIPGVQPIQSMIGTSSSPGLSQAITNFINPVAVPSVNSLIGGGQ